MIFTFERFELNVKTNRRKIKFNDEKRRKKRIRNERNFEFSCE